MAAKKFTVGRHPEWKLKASIFKYAVFCDGKLFEGFVHYDSAEQAAAEYNAEASQ